MLWIWLVGCEAVSTVCETSGLCYETESGPPEEVLYTGSVTQGPPGGEVTYFEEGTLVFVDPASGDLLVDGVQPYSANPGIWQATLPSRVDYELRIEGPDSYPAVWRGRSPRRIGWWYTGAIFSWPVEVWDAVVADLEAQGSGPFGDLSEGDRVHLWGSPVDSDLNVLPLGPDRVSIVDGEGNLAEVLLVAAAEVPDGEPVPTFFLAFDLAPGDITVTVSGESGEVVETVYRTVGGEIVSAWWFEVPE